MPPASCGCRHTWRKPDASGASSEPGGPPGPTTGQGAQFVGHMSQQSLNVGATVRRMATYLRPHWKAQVGAVLASLVTVGAELPAPLLIKALVDDVAIGGDLSLLPPLLIALGALAIAGSIAAIAANYLFTSAGEQAANVLRRALMDQVLRLPLSYFRGHRTGDTVTHFTADSAAIAEGIRARLWQWTRRRHFSSRHRHRRGGH